MNELKKYIEEKIAEIEADERFHYPSADVWANAPLALIQMGMSSRMQTLKEILKQIK